MVLFQDIAEHLTTIHLSRCERGKRCLYEGSTPPGGFPNTWVIKSLIPAIKTICDATSLRVLIHAFLDIMMTG